MSATDCSQLAEVGCETTSRTDIRLMCTTAAPALARRYVQRELAVPLTASRVSDILLLTSEVVTNVVEHSRAGPIDISIVGGPTFTRIEVSNPGEQWDRRPALCSTEPDEEGGWGLFFVEELSDRWGIRDCDRTVWFEFDHPALLRCPDLDGLADASDPMHEIWALLQQVRYPASRHDLVDMAAAVDASAATIARLKGLGTESHEDAEQVSQALVDRRVESNRALVAITAEACERCGFLRVPGEPHSCIEEKARFADSVNDVSDEFDAITSLLR